MKTFNITVFRGLLLTALGFILLFFSSCIKEKEMECVEIPEVPEKPEFPHPGDLVSHKPYECECGDEADFLILNYIESGQPEYAEGYRGMALRRRLNNTARLEYVPDPDNPFADGTAQGATMTFWLKLLDLPGEDESYSIFSMYRKDSAPYFGFTIDGDKYAWRFSDEYEQSTKSVIKDRWTHIGLTGGKDNNNILWLDGQKEMEISIESAWAIGLFRMMSHFDYFGIGNFEGLIDELRIYSRAFTAEEMKKLYETEVAAAAAEKAEKEQNP